MSTYDPQRKSSNRICCDAQRVVVPRQLVQFVSELGLVLRAKLWGWFDG